MLTLLAFAGNLLGTFISKFGLILMKMVHLNKEKETGEEEDKKSIYCRGLWWLGFASIMCGVMFCFFTLAYLSLILVGATLILGVAFNTLLSIKLLGEQFVWKYDLPALSLMCIGALLLTLCAVPEENLMTYEQMVGFLDTA